MYKLVRILVLITIVWGLPRSSSAQREMSATRVYTTLKIDGQLDEPAWIGAVPATDFVQLEPIVDAPPTARTEVKVIYDNEGLYIGAHLYQDPSTILKELSPRDSKNNTDWFAVTLDSYASGVNGFAFIVTAAGVQQDQSLTGGNGDNNWNAVWESSVSMVDDGWIVEMKLPYAALRFPDQKEQVWNIQFGRELRYIREQVYWNRLDPQIEGFINQCGVLTGIKDIKSPVRLSLTPFVVGYVDHESGVNASTSNAYSAGMDLKYGINDAFTLDMTLIPDFGQVISDNVVVNLGPFEQFFEENRQFFTEGVELFNKGDLFYSRRIGGRPLNSSAVRRSLAEHEIITDNPNVSRLINATKVSGRTPKGTGLGLFNGVVADEYATVLDTVTGSERLQQTNPYTNYNVFVVDQNLANNSVVTLVNTNTFRFGEDYDANVTGGFFDLRNEAQQYGVVGKVVASQKYLTDATDIGHSYGIEGGKIGGAWRVIGSYNVESDNYDINDLGFLFSPNERSASVRVEYNEFTPKNKDVVRWNVWLSPQYERLYSPNEFVNFGVQAGGFILYKSRLAFGGNIGIEPTQTNDFFEPRTADFSKAYKFPTSQSIGGFVSTDYRKPLAGDIRFFYRNFGEEGRSYLNIELEPRVRFNNKLSVIGSLVFENAPNQIGFLDNDIVQSGIDGIGGTDVLFGRRDRVTMQNSLTVNYIFTNNMALSGRIRHYWDRFNYDQYTRLEDDGSLTPLAFDGLRDDGSSYYDNNVNIFNIDLFYTWRFAPGSDLIFAYKNQVFKSDDEYDRNYLSNLTNLFDANQFNSVSLRIIYFLDYQAVFAARNPD